MHGKLILLLGPSGVGKGTVRALLKERHPEFVFPPSVTTRVPRPGEVDGDNYFFISHEEFQEKLQKHEFLEWASPHGLEYYGTLIDPIRKALEAGKTVIREIDLKGLRTVLGTSLRPNVYSIFLTPPSLEDLQRRIEGRSALSSLEMKKRLLRAEQEIAESDICDKKILAEEGEIDKIYRQVEEAIAESLESI